MYDLQVNFMFISQLWNPIRFGNQTLDPKYKTLTSSSKSSSLTKTTISSSSTVILQSNDSTFQLWNPIRFDNLALESKYNTTKTSLVTSSTINKSYRNRSHVGRDTVLRHDICKKSDINDEQVVLFCVYRAHCALYITHYPWSQHEPLLSAHAYH